RLRVGGHALRREPTHGTFAVIARGLLEGITLFHFGGDDSDQSDGAVSDGLLGLHPAVAETSALSAGESGRRAIHDDGDLAAHVGVGVVVVMPMRRADAVADKNRRRFHADISGAFV